MLIIAALIYFFGMNSKYIIDGNGKYGLGCGIDQDKYKNIEIFEPLASGSNKNKLPASFSLLKYANLQIMCKQNRISDVRQH